MSGAMQDVACGFPIVTEKRSSSSFRLPSFEDDGVVEGGENGSTGISTQRTNNDVFGFGPDGTTRDPCGSTFRRKFGIRNNQFMGGSNGYGNGHGHGHGHGSEGNKLGAPMSLSAMDTDSEGNLIATITIRYHDVVEKTYHREVTELKTPVANESVSESQNVENEKSRKRSIITVHTTIMTIADVYINISLASEAFASSDGNSQTRSHKITLSATSNTEEIDEEFITNEDFDVYANDHHMQHYTWSDVQPQVTFSSNAKYLACIIPRPIRQDKDSSEHEFEADNNSASNIVHNKAVRISTLVVFNLEAQTIEKEVESIENSMEDLWGRIPQPAYLRTEQTSNFDGQLHNKSGNDEGKEKKSTMILPPVATNPQCATLNPSLSSAPGNDVTVDLAKLLSQITCICDLNHQSDNNQHQHLLNYGSSSNNFQNAPIFLAGCTDGSIVVISYKKSMVLGMLYHNRGRGSGANQSIPLNSNASASTRLQNNDRNKFDARTSGLLALKYCVGIRNRRGIDCDGNGSIHGRILGVQRDGHVTILSTKFRSNSIFPRRASGGVDPNNGFAWESKKFRFEMTAKPLKGLYGNYLSSAIATAKYVNCTFIDFNTVGLLVKPLNAMRGQGRDMRFNDLIAQVLNIDEYQRGEISLELIAELLFDNDKLEENAHGSFENRKNSCSLSTFCGLSMPTTSIEYDSISGCLILSSVIPIKRSTKTNTTEAKAFVSLWDWKSSTIGFTLASRHRLHFSTKQTVSRSTHPLFLPSESFVSRQMIQRKAGATYIVHTFGGKFGYQRDIYLAGILSPSRGRRSCRGLQDQNPIFLSKDYVMYPSLLQPSVNKEIQVEWKRSVIPTSYSLNNGPIVTAVICEKFGRSIAAIGSRGLCVLDIHREHCSKQISFNSSQSAQYSTSCLEGFECEASDFQFKSSKDRWRMFQRLEEQSFTVRAMVWWEGFGGLKEDVILAVVKYVNHVDACYYLVAWSSRRLEMGVHQLIDNISRTGRHSEKSDRGLRLPEHFIPESISTLIEDCGELNDRAVACVTGKREGVPYHSTIQLQICEGDGNCPVDKIIALEAVNGKLPLVKSSSDHVFLVSCSYRFDLNLNKIDKDQRFATIGILHNHGSSLSAVAIDNKEKLSFAEIVDLRNKPIDANRIVQVWRSDFSPSSNHAINERSCTWTWSFMKSNGVIFSWVLGDNLPTDEENLRFALHRRICTNCGPLEKNDANSCPYSFGIKSNERRSLKGSITDDRTILLGSLSTPDHRHLLYSGQARTTSGTCARFGVADFDIGIPSSTGGILLALSMITECQLTKQEQIAECMAIQVMYYIQKMHNSETIFAGLRSIISFLTELISRKERRSVEDETERKNFLKATQGALIRITISSLIQVQFISLFLNVGRQLEPHHFKSLFPLSLSLKERNSDEVLNLEDLFDMAVNDGSFSVPGAALPLFANKTVVHSLCINLLHHCINKILKINDTAYIEIKSLREECRSIQQLYSYIIKVEDSERMIHMSERSASERSFETDGVSSGYEIDGSTNNEESTSEEFSMVDSVMGTSYDDHVSKHQQVKPKSGISQFASRLIRPLISSKENLSESAISDAASSFILSSYKDDIQEPAKLQDLDSILSQSASDSSISTADEGDVTAYFENEQFTSFNACSVLGMSIISCVYLVQEASSLNIARALKKIATLCLLLRNENESSTLSSIESHSVAQLLTNLTTDDYHNAMLTVESSHAGDSVIITDSSDATLSANAIMEMLLSEGANEWNFECADAVSEVIASILARQENSPHILSLSPLLSMLLVAACHVANKPLPFDGTQCDCALADLYYAD